MTENSPEKLTEQEIEELKVSSRWAIAMVSLKGRLSMAIRMGKTDSFALQAARGWAQKVGYEGKMRTMRQALEWVQEQVEVLHGRR